MTLGVTYTRLNVRQGVRGEPGLPDDGGERSGVTPGDMVSGQPRAGLSAQSLEVLEGGPSILTAGADSNPEPGTSYYVELQDYPNPEGRGAGNVSHQRGGENGTP